MKFDNILYENENGILKLTLNRPEMRNALTPEMWDDIVQAVRCARDDDSVKVILVSGAGDKALASGADIKEIRDRNYMGQMRARSSEALKELAQIFKPTICCINGFALGGGCEVAMACDIRIATKRSKFGQPETGLGIMPGAGGTQRLARLIGVGRAKELIFTGRIIAAEEAYQIGLVNKLTENDTEDLMRVGHFVAETIMSKGPTAIKLAKISIDYGMQTDMNTALMLERLAQTIAFSTEDRKEGAQAFLEHRLPEFKGY